MTICRKSIRTIYILAWVFCFIPTEVMSYIVEISTPTPKINPVKKGYTLFMETKILNYRIIVEPEKDPQTSKRVYVAICPKLGVSDWGNTIDQAIIHIQEAIECHLESLIKHGKSVPSADQNEFV